MDGVSVVIPGSGGEIPGETLESVLGQDSVELEVLLVGAPGSGPRPDRVREIDAPAGAARACNTGLREARHEFVVFLPPGDSAHGGALAERRALLAAHPTLGGVSCGWRRVDESGREIGAQIPPVESADVRWRLAAGPCLAPGAVMVRRREALSAGGFDERLSGGCDYDLWLRMADKAPIGGIPRVMHTTRRPAWLGDGDDVPDAIAWLMVRAWTGLPAAHSATRAELVRDLAQLVRDPASAPDVVSRLEDGLGNDGPSVEGLAAWMWARAQGLEREREARRLAASDRLRAVLAAAASIGPIWLMGDDAEIDWVLASGAGAGVAGVIEGGRERPGVRRATLDALAGHVGLLLCSALRDAELWDRTGAVRARGVRVFRLFGIDPGA